MRSLLTDLGIEVHDDPNAAVGGGSSSSKVAAGIVDATGLSGPADLAEVQAFLTPVMRRIGPSGRILVIGDVPAEATSPAVRAARRALEGLVRSAGKEARYGATVNLVHVADGVENDLESTLRFFLSSRSAFVHGQRLDVGTVPGFSGSSQGVDWDKPLAGRTAVVTGAARGIGATVASTLRRDGATVICVDVPSAGDALARTANDIGGSALQLDITADHAPATLLEHAQRHGGLDIVVHNAGITRDKLLANQDRDRWNSVIDVNLNAQLAINDALLGSEVFHRGGRIVTVSSMAGIAGNRGQTSYGASGVSARTSRTRRALDHRLLERAGGVGDRRERVVDGGQIGDDHQQASHGERAVEHVKAADPEDECRARQRDRAHDHREQRFLPGEAQPRAPRAVAGVAEAAELVRLAGEALDHLDRGQDLEHPLDQRRLQRLHALGALYHPARVVAERHPQEGHHHQREQRQRDVEPHQDREHHRELDHRHRQREDAADHQVVDAVGVGLEAVDPVGRARGDVMP